MRRLSAAIQNQQASGRLRSGEMAPTAIPPWPACPTLLGRAHCRCRALRLRRWTPGPLRAPRYWGQIRTPPTRRSYSRETPAPAPAASRAWARRRPIRAAQADLRGDARCAGSPAARAVAGLRRRTSKASMIVKLNWVSKIACGIFFLLESRLTGSVPGSSSTPAVPYSLAGAKISITEERTASWACRRRRNSASAIAAGCAITWMAESYSFSSDSSSDLRPSAPAGGHPDALRLRR